MDLTSVVSTVFFDILKPAGIVALVVCGAGAVGLLCVGVIRLFWRWIRPFDESRPEEWPVDPYDGIRNDTVCFHCGRHPFGGNGPYEHLPKCASVLELARWRKLHPKRKTS